MAALLTDKFRKVAFDVLPNVPTYYLMPQITQINTRPGNDQHSPDSHVAAAFVKLNLEFAAKHHEHVRAFSDDDKVNRNLIRVPVMILNSSVQACHWRPNSAQT